MAEISFSVEQFLESLPRVSNQDLPAGSECMICQDQYGSATDTNEEIEHAVFLECAHLIGHECLKIWLLERGKNTCPYCRRELFPPIPTESDEESDDEGEEVDYEAILDSLGFGEEQLATALLRYGEIEATIDALDVSEAEHIEAVRTHDSRERQLYELLLPEGPELPPLGSVQGSVQDDISCWMALGEELRKRGAFDLVVLRGVRPVSGEVDWFLWEMLRHYGYVWRPRMLVQGVEVASGWELGNGALMATIDSRAYRGQLSNA